jgi:hypothetical protein
MLDSDTVEEQHRDVFAEFGATAARATDLETVVLNLLLLNAKRSGKVTTSEDFDAFETRLQGAKKPLGQLLKDLHAGTTIPGRTRDALDRALADRNFLIHHFFRDRAFGFATEEGRGRMVNELRDIHNRIWAATRLADDLFLSLAQDFGITAEAIKAEAKRLRTEARAAENLDTPPPA